jgi:hypothetical protein
VQFPETRYQSGPVSLSIASIAALLSFGVACVQAATSAAARSIFGRPGWASCWRRFDTASLDRAHGQHEPRQAIGLVALRNPLSQPHRFLHVAIGGHGQVGAGQEFGVARIAAQRGAVIGGGGGRVALGRGVAGGKEAAGDRGTRVGRGRLCRNRREARPGQGGCGNGGERRGPELGRSDHGSVNSIWRTNAFGAAAFAVNGRE